MKLAWQDHAVVIAYLAVTLLIGLITSQRQNSNEEYFLAKRELPWWALGFSLLATVLSSLTLLAEPAEVWTGGVLPTLGRVMALPVAVAIVALFIIPFLTRFKFTSVYEFLEYRFNPLARLLAVVLFTAMTVGSLSLALWLSAQALGDAAGMPTILVLAVAGIAVTLYTTMGGMRAVVWTHTVQMLLLLTGGGLCLWCLVSRTGVQPWDWYQFATDLHTKQHRPELPFFQAGLFAPNSVMTIAIVALLGQLGLHSGSQTTVQRYFAAGSPGTARSAYLWATLLGVTITGILAMAGLGMLFYFAKSKGMLPPGVSAESTPRDVLPTFVMEQLPAGIRGTIVCGLLAAVMAAVSAGINSLATVLCLEGGRTRPRSRFSPGAGDVRADSDTLLAPARWVTFIAGVVITGAAIVYDQGLATKVVAIIPRAIPCALAPLGTMVFIGMFFPFVTGRAIVPATLCGIAMGVSLAFTQELYELSLRLNPLWVMPASIWTTALCAVVFSLLDRPKPQQTFGLTVFTQHQDVLYDIPLHSKEAA